MKCSFCGEDLHPLLLKQAIQINNKLLLDIECLNLSCRKHNWITKEHYLFLRNDHFKPYPFKLNNKLPKHMNIIMVSNERCGISWIAKTISRIHESMFGTYPKWNFEVSKVIARKKHLPIFKGWSTVYDTDPQKLIDHGYDRVLIIQRDYNELLKAHLLYEYDAVSDDHAIQNEELVRNRLKKYYEIIYGKEIDNKKCLKIRLEDLNKYTIATFNEILDFLNFPSYGRPIIIPTSPPQRNWEAYSSILPKGHKLCNRLEKIDEIKIDRSD